MYALSIILLTLAGVTFIAAALGFYVNKNPIYLFWAILTIVLIFPGLAFLEQVPTKQDIIRGKAIYVEEWHINGNDTVKTYDIVFKKKECD